MIKKRTQAIFSHDDGEAYGGGMMKKLSASHGKKWLQKFVFANMKTDTWQAGGSAWAGFNPGRAERKSSSNSIGR